MRRIIARGLLGMALLALLGDLFFVWNLIPAYQKMQRTGDGASFGLGLTFLLFLFLPLTLDLALAGLLLDQPAWLRKTSAMRAGVCGVTLAGAIVPLLAAVGLQVRGLWGAYHLYQQRDWALVAVFLQNLALSLPLLALAGLLVLGAVRLWTVRGGEDREDYVGG